MPSCLAALYCCAGADGSHLCRAPQFSPAHPPRRDLGEIKATPSAPGEELLHGVKISTTGVCVANLAVEKFLSGEDCRGAPHKPDFGLCGMARVRGHLRDVRCQTLWFKRSH